MVGSSVAVSSTRAGPVGPLRVGVVGILGKDFGISAPVAGPRDCGRSIRFGRGRCPPCGPAALSILTGLFPAGCGPVFREGLANSLIHPRRFPAGSTLFPAPPVRVAPASGAVMLGETLQFTNRRMRMFITMPSAKNMNTTDEPP